MQGSLAGGHHLSAPSPFQTSPTKIFNKLTRLLCADYNEEWFPLNDPTWHDKSGQPYGKVPATLDWISYDVRTAATLHLTYLSLA